MISSGTNDLDNSSKTFQNLRNYLVNLNHTNVLLLSIPFRFDLTNYDTMNSKITVLNKKLQKLTRTLPYTRFLDSDNNWKLFTNHGLHCNKLGKQLVTAQIAQHILLLYITGPHPLYHLNCMIQLMRHHNYISRT